jgi:arylsulfatase
MPQTFNGRVGRDWRDSTPWWPPTKTPPDGAPNVVLIVLDDVGFAQLGCYGSNIETPVIDELAAGGVRLSNFHTTSLCSPTRSCLLTGRNHHRNAMGRVADLAVGFPGYWGRIPKENGFISEILRDAGYATYAVGKWHLTPHDEANNASSRSTWPLARGFDRWYGFHGGETHQLVPALFHDNHAVAPPFTDVQGYHLSTDLADRAIEFLGDLRAVDAQQPFFLYFATGACHSPHQPPPAWREHYAGRFDTGWDAWRDETFARQIATGLLPPSTELSPRPPWVPAWEDLRSDQREVAARFMECYAGFLSHADEQIGRVLTFLRDVDEFENTLVIVVSDNGASAEGGPDGSINDVRLFNIDPASPQEMYERRDEIGGTTTHNNYPWGWTMAGNTPFRRWKREVHQGGVADPCIVHWPASSIARGEIREQFAHAVDVFSTIAELVGIEPPASIESVAQSRVDGLSFAYALSEQCGDIPERHQTQYFEMFGSRGIYHDGWKAVAFHPIAPLYDDQNPNDAFDDDVWELYDVRKDRSEVHDVASLFPNRLEELKTLWWREAENNNVLPLDNRVLWALVHPKPDHRHERSMFRYFQGAGPVPETVAVNVRNRSHRIVVDLTLPQEGSVDGVLLALGSALGGWSFHILNGHLRYVHNLYGAARHVIHASDELLRGRHEVRYEFTKDEGLGGDGKLFVDGLLVGEGVIERFTPSGFNATGVGLTCGYEWGPPVGEGYAAPFAFPGKIHRAIVETTGPVVRDPIAEIEAILSEQ